MNEWTATAGSRTRRPAEARTHAGGPATNPKPADLT